MEKTATEKEPGPSIANETEEAAKVMALPCPKLLPMLWFMVWFAGKWLPSIALQIGWGVLRKILKLLPKVSSGGWVCHREREWKWSRVRNVQRLEVRAWKGHSAMHMRWQRFVWVQSST